MQEKSSERFLVLKAGSKAGFGDKLRALISAIVYARWSARTLFVDWRDGAYGPIEHNYFHDLIRLNGVPVVDVLPISDSVRPEVWRDRLHLNIDEIYKELGSPPWSYAWAKNTLSFDLGVKDWNETVCVMFDFLQFEVMMPHLSRLYPTIGGHETKEQMEGEVVRQHIRPVPALEAALNAEISRLDAMRPLVGVHVRASDEHFLARTAPPVKAYIKAVRQTIRKSGAHGILLATDNSDVQKEFVLSFGKDRVVWRQKWMPAPGGAIHLSGTCPDRLQAGTDAFLDILLLASADFLITFLGSSFSIAARMFSKTTEDCRTTLIAKMPIGRRVWNRFKVNK